MLDTQLPKNNTPEQKENTEFATKGPLLEKKDIKKYAIIGVISILVIGILFVGIMIVQQIIKANTPIEETPETKPDVVVVEEKKDKPNMAYIKNLKTIWIATTDGSEKFQLLEIPATSQEIFSDIEWKNRDVITYSKCASSTCSIESYNVKDKSLIVEVSANNNPGYVNRIKWDKTAKYLAFIKNNGDQYTLNLKAGTVTQTFRTLKAQITNPDIDSKIVFDNQSQYVAMFLTEKTFNERDSSEKEPILVPTTYVYLPNGVIVDEIKDSADPEFDGENNLYYISNKNIYLKTVGESNQTLVTPLSGRNIAISNDSNLIAYWDDKGGFANSRLNIYDLKQNLHRNILRGIILPKWISEKEVVGIKPESCIGTTCQLYQFQTTSLYIVNIQDTSLENSVIQVDQGKTLSSLKYNIHAN